jgi:hypothetical protein
MIDKKILNFFELIFNTLNKLYLFPAKTTSVNPHEFVQESKFYKRIWSFVIVNSKIYLAYLLYKSSIVDFESNLINSSESLIQIIILLLFNSILFAASILELPLLLDFEVVCQAYGDIIKFGNYLKNIFYN